MMSINDLQCITASDLRMVIHTMAVDKSLQDQPSQQTQDDPFDFGDLAFVLKDEHDKVCADYSELLKENGELREANETMRGEIETMGEEIEAFKGQIDGLKIQLSQMYGMSDATGDHIQW